MIRELPFNADRDWGFGADTESAISDIAQKVGMTINRFDWEGYNATLQVKVFFDGKWWIIDLGLGQSGVIDSLRAIHNASFKSTVSNPSNLDAVMSERGSTHGDFGDNATIALQTRELWRAQKPGWSNCTAEQRLALEEIALKVARILSGGQDVKEHWLDIAGYSTLGSKSCDR